MQLIRRLLALLAALVCSLALTVSTAPLAFANAGDLDPAFGSGGIVTTAFGPGADAVPSAIAIQEDGKIVVGGYAYAYDGHYKFALARYLETGALDPTFGLEALGNSPPALVANSISELIPFVQATDYQTLLNTDGIPNQFCQVDEAAHASSYEDFQCHRLGDATVFTVWEKTLDFFASH